MGWGFFEFRAYVRSVRAGDSPMAHSIREFEEKVRLWHANESPELDDYAKSSHWLPDDLAWQLLREGTAHLPDRNIIIAGYPVTRSQSLRFETPDWYLAAVAHLPGGAPANEGAAERGRDRAQSHWVRDEFPLVEHYQKRHMVLKLDPAWSVQETASHLKTDVEARFMKLVEYLLPKDMSVAVRGGSWEARKSGRSSRVYRIQKDASVHFLKVSRIGDGDMTRAGAVLTDDVMAGFPLDLPAPTAPFASRNGLGFLLTRELRGVTVKSLLKAASNDSGRLKRIIRAWARALVRIHGFHPGSAAKASGLFADLSFPALLERARERLAAGLISPDAFSARYEGTGIRDPGLELNAVAEAAGEFSFTTDVFLHGDPCAPNLMMDPESLEVTGCLDVGGMGLGDPAWDLALAEWSLRHNTTGLPRNALSLEYHGDPALGGKVELMYRLARFIL